MGDYIYCQLNADNICVCISKLKGEVPEYNYVEKPEYNPITGENTITKEFVSRMIKVDVYSENYIGLKYNNGSWETVTP